MSKTVQSVLLLLLPINAYCFGLNFSRPPICRASGGISIKDGTINFEHLSKEFYKYHGCADKDQLPKARKNIKEFQAEIDAALLQIKSEDNCYELAPIVDKYRNRIEDNNKIHEQNMQIFHERFKNPMKQTESYLWQVGIDACTAAHSSWNISAYWDLYRDLVRLKAKKRVFTLYENFASFDSCKNVIVNGSEDMNTFYVNTADSIDGIIKIRYNTYSVPDQIFVYGGEKQLIDSKCIGTRQTVEREINVNRIGSDKKIKIEVDAKCADNSSTGWTVEISCRSNRKDAKREYSKVCSSYLNSLRSLIERAVNNEAKIQSQLWADADCNFDTTNKFFSMLDLKYAYFNENFIKEWKQGAATFGISHDQRSVKLKLPKTGAKHDSKSVSTVRKLSSFRGKWFKKRFSKEDLKQNCPSKVEAAGDLFKKVSRAYCTVGYKRLFNYNDSIWPTR